MRVSVMLWLCCSPVVCAESATPPGEALPEMELLEFISEWQTDQGEFIDPMEIEQLPMHQPDTEATRRDQQE